MFGCRDVGSGFLVSCRDKNARATSRRCALVARSVTGTPSGVSGTARWVRLNSSGRLPWRPGVDGSAFAEPIQRPIPPGAHRSWLVPARISSDSSYRDRSLTGDCRDPGTGGSTRRGGAYWARPRRPRVARTTIQAGFGWFSSAGLAVSARVEAMRSALAPLNCPR